MDDAMELQIGDVYSVRQHPSASLPEGLEPGELVKLLAFWNGVWLVQTRSGMAFAVSSECLEF